MVNIFIIWGLIVLFIVQPGVAHDGAEAGARLFVHALLPYLLPYIILTQWLLKMPSTGKVVTPWKKYVKAYVLGSFGGFPVGAVTVSEMTKNEELTRKQAGLILASCHAPGPMFIIGFVGIELFNDISTGWKLLIAIHIANIIFFFMTLLFLKNESELKSTSHPPVTKRPTMPLLDSLKDSSEIIILVATTVIFFSALGIVLSSVIAAAFSVDTGIAQTVTLSIFEMTSGVQAATDHFSGLTIFPLLIAAIISLNGFSIHIQVAVIAKSAKISLRPYVIGRFWCTLIVPLLFYLLL